MIKYIFIFVLSFSICLLSCKKKKNSFGYKIVGTWVCDSIRKYMPDNNGTMVYDTTDTTPKTYVFKKIKGKDKCKYKWNDIEIQMNESEGSFYKEGALGDIGDTWFIKEIEEHKCVLKLDNRSGTGSYITDQQWYYLSR